MKIGITGASGFLGAAILEELNRRGWEGVAFSREADRVVEGSVETRELPAAGEIDLGGLDALINLAGEPIAGLWTEERKRNIRESRIDLTLRLVEAMEGLPRARRPAVFVSASASGFYGDRGDEWLDEEADPGFGFLAGVCRDWEAAAMGAERLGVRVVVPRIGLVLDRGGGFLGTVRTVFRAFLGGRLGDGNQWMPWVHRRDLARAFADCVASETMHGRVNCVSPAPVTNREFTERYAEALGRKAFLPVPTPLLRRLPGGMGALFLDSQRVEPVVLKAFGFEWEFSDLESALKEIETKPR